MSTHEDRGYGDASIVVSYPAPGRQRFTTTSWDTDRRHQPVRETGWYPAEATLKSALSLNDARFVGRSAQRVWIGGTDERMVVLHPHGRWRSKPYAVPARGRKPRDPGPRR